MNTGKGRRKADLLLLSASPVLMQSASKQAVELIRAAILEGRVHPGQRLRAEQVAKELNLSRTPVREAFLLLEANGLVESTPNRGALVRRYQPEELMETYSLRAVLEGHAASLAASRVTPECLERLAASCERFCEVRQSGDVVEMVRENRHFHELVLDAAGMPRLKLLVLQLVQLPLIYKGFSWYNDDQRLIAEHYHRRVTRTLELHDSERSAAAMREHVLDSGEFLTAAIKEHGKTSEPAPKAAPGD
jgi:DNA-binding GntR family transcriptional regulator